MPSNPSGTVPDLTPLRARLAHADANPVVEHADNGDQNPITVPHVEMDAYLKVVGKGPEWDHLWKLRRDPAAQSCISREYPGLWIRALVTAIGKGV